MHWIKAVRPMWRRNRRGTAIVEFAIGSGVLLAVFSGTFEFGYTLMQYNKLQTAVAQGARYASLVPYDSATATPSAAFLLKVRNIVLYGNPAGGDAPALSGLTAANVNLNVTFTNGVPSSVQVSITGYTVNAVFGSRTFTGKPQATYPYQGIWAPV
jgi:Flp pilus assembly protein TadG